MDTLTLVFAVMGVAGCVFAIFAARRLDVWFKGRRTVSAAAFFVAATSAILYAIPLIIETAYQQQVVYPSNPLLFAIPVGAAIYAVMVLTGAPPNEKA
jgi:hypothetical protein